MAFRITAGNKDDRKPLEAMSAALQGKIFSDKGYLSQLLLERIWQRGLHLGLMYVSTQALKSRISTCFWR